ncbi:MAG: HAMP domain-containing histidine kinase [Lachnospiraceae bacterium]|nr:HAMP domain-containing histidine kinase [Lachnospiraceae bacterium]
MKPIIKIGILYTVLMAAVLLLFISRYDTSRLQERDIAYYNDCLVRMYEDYENGAAEAVMEETYDCNIIFAKELVQSELTEYYRSGALVLDFSPGGEYLGKVVWDDMRQNGEQLKASLRKTVLIVWAGMLIAGYLLLAFLWMTLLRPIAELSAYSSEIAKGNLDVPLPMRKKSMFGSLVESFDIMREELKAARQREIDAGIAKKEMIAALSHDIKTPIATIRATCEVLEMKCQRKLAMLQKEKEADDGQPDPEAETKTTPDLDTGNKSISTEHDIDPDRNRKERNKRESKSSDEKKSAANVSEYENDIRDTMEKAASIMAKAQLIESLMNNLLHTSLEELDRIEVDPQEQPSELIEQYFKNMKDAGEGHAVILDNEIPKCLIYMDKLRMEQVIDNCVGNSVKYAGTDIHVSFDTVDGGYIRIRIHDAGPGVSREDLPLLTEKYYRGKGSSGKAGYGLGMYLVKLYMEKQGGGLEYYNDNGFTVELLVKKV